MARLPSALRSRSLSTRAGWSRSGLMALAGVFALSTLAAPGTAEAKKKKKKKKAAHVQLTGVKSLDKTFKPLKKLDSHITKAQKARRKGAAAINDALGLKQGTSLNQAMRHLQSQAKGKVKVKMEGGTPQLKPSDALPTHIAKGIEAVNVLLKSEVTAIKELAQAPAEAQKLVKQAKALPTQLKSELASNPLEAVTILRNLGVVKDNIKVAVGLPKRATKVTKNLNKDLKLIVTGFGGSWPPVGR